MSSVCRAGVFENQRRAGQRSRDDIYLNSMQRQVPAIYESGWSAVLITRRVGRRRGAERYTLGSRLPTATTTSHNTRLQFAEPHRRNIDICRLPSYITSVRSVWSLPVAKRSKTGLQLDDLHLYVCTRVRVRIYMWRIWFRLVSSIPYLDYRRTHILRLSDDDPTMSPARVRCTSTWTTVSVRLHTSLGDD